MEKIVITLLLLICWSTTSAQNIFPTPSGDVGIGTTSPQSTLHVRTGALSSINPAHWADDIVIENDNHVGITLFTPVNRTGHILFGTSTNYDAARIHYQHDTEKMQFFNQGTTALTIDNAQNIGIGTASPISRLHITSNNLGTISPATWSDDLVIENNDHTGITIFSASDKYGHILFGSPSNNDAARIHFQHNTNKMQFATQGVKAITIDGNQNVGIGTENPLSKLAVNGQIRATEVKVLANISVPDYVFEPDYELRTLKETKEYITENKHLPEIPSAAEIGENGIDLGDMNMRLLKKIEELTLYQIELLEKVEELRSKVEKLENK